MPQTQPWVAWPGCLLCDPHQGHQELLYNMGPGMELPAPLGTAIAGGEMTFTCPQAGPCVCGKCRGYIHELSERWAFLPRCWVLGAPEAPTWHLCSCAELGMDGAWGVTLAAFPGQCFGAPAAPGCKQCCGSWSRLDRQLHPAQVCENSRCCLSWATGQPSFLVSPNQSLPSVAQRLEGVKVDPWLYFGFHLSDSKIKKM